MAIDDRASESASEVQSRLGLVVRSQRRRLNITQEELAWRADMHRTYIADIERGARNITLRSIVNLARALQLTVGNLLSHAAEGESGAERKRSPAAREILLVEDNQMDAAMTVCAFEQARVTNPVRVVHAAEEALDYLFGRSGRGGRKRLPRPRLILLDLNFPGMSGLDFLRRIKADRRTRDLPVVALTVSRSDRLIIECARLGAQNYIVKPLDIESILRITPRLNLNLTLGRAGPPRKKAH